MPVFMDRHNLEGAEASQVAAAHVADLRTQEKYDVKFLTYWFDAQHGRAFCLVDAPKIEDVAAVHREAHGLVGDDIIEVQTSAVEEFLGRIEGTAASEKNFEPSHPTEESAFRTILFTDMEGSTEMTQRLGDEGAMVLLRTHNSIIRDALATSSGSEVKHTGDGIMASFATPSRAVECSIAVQQGFHTHNEAADSESRIRVRIGITAGEPVAEDEDLFGAAVQLAARICNCAEPNEILVANVMRELCIGKGFSFSDRGAQELRGFKEPVQVWEVRWRED